MADMKRGERVSAAETVVVNAAVPSPWWLYDELIERIPAEVLVRDCCVGVNWTYVEAEGSAQGAASGSSASGSAQGAALDGNAGSASGSGPRNIGLAYTLSGGGAATHSGRFDGLPLRELASLSKSWNWREASIGIAALNAWYTTAERIVSLGGVLSPTRFDVETTEVAGTAVASDGSREHAHKGERDFDPERHIGSDPLCNKLVTDPFCVLREEYCGKKVTVVGHFPGLDALAEVSDLTILERSCRDAQDVPDPACEYLLPSQDFVFMTGVTLINKTVVRLLELAHAATVILVGPSVIAAEPFFARGADVLAGRVVVDTELARAAVKQGTRFADALQTYLIKRL